MSYEAVCALAELEVSNNLTEEDLDAVERTLKAHGIDYFAAYTLDAGPGRYGYRVNGREWHYKLRQYRNSRYWSNL